MKIKYFLALFLISIIACNQQSAAIIPERSGNGSWPYIENEEVEITSFDKAGYPTIQAIEILTKEQYFKDRDFVQATIIEEGKSNHRLYCVSVNGTPRLFLKVSNSTNSYIRLMALQQSTIGRLGIEKKLIEGHHLFKQNLPIITWLEKIFIYTNPWGEQQKIEVCHAAKGKSINQIIRENDPAATQRALIAIGKALGSFQQAFMDYRFSTDPLEWKTIAHGDFHGGNIFFDDHNSRVSFIDNEKMSTRAYSYVFEDFKGFYFGLGLPIYYKTKQWTHYPLLPESIIEQFRSFTQGYLQTFPKDKKIILIDYLKNHMNEILNKVYELLLRVDLNNYEEYKSWGMYSTDVALTPQELVIARAHKNQLIMSLTALFEYLLQSPDKAMSLLDEKQAIIPITHLQKRIKTRTFTRAPERTPGLLYPIQEGDENGSQLD